MTDASHARRLKRPPACGAFLISVFVLLLASFAASADKKTGPTVVRRSNVRVNALGAAILPAKDNCANWGWAAAVETVLHSHHLDISQSYWIDKIYGGRCEDNVPSLEDAARLISGEYREATGEKYRLEATFTSGPPVVIDEILLSLMSDTPIIIYYQNRPLLLTGILYDEAWYPTGNKLFDVKEVEMHDPLLPAETITFKKGTDCLSDIGGLLKIRVVRD